MRGNPWERNSRFSPCPKLVMLGLVFYLTSSNMSVIHDMDYLIRLWHEDFEEEKNILCHLLRLIDILTFFTSSQTPTKMLYTLRNSCKEIRYLLTRTKFVLDEDTERSGGWEEHRPLCEHGSDYPPLGEAHLITLPSYSSSSLSSSHCHLQHHQAESLSTGW